MTTGSGVVSDNGSAPQSSDREGIEPTRDPRVTLVELVDTLLNRGLYLNLDVIISVADIPLIGLNLRATLAGMETMLEYGMMRDWDHRTRAWVEKTAARDLPMDSDEQLVAKMAGGYFHEDDFHRDWRPGSLYLTSHRLLVFRRDPRQILWQVPLDQIRTVELVAETTVGGEKLDRLHVTSAADVVSVLSASSPQRMREMLLEQSPTVQLAQTQRPGGALLAARQAERAQQAHGYAASQPLREGHLWYQEKMYGRTEWRGGVARLDDAGLTWKGAMDARPAIRLEPGQVRAVRVESGRSPFGDATMMIETGAGELVLAGADAPRWEQALNEFIAGHQDDPKATEDDDGTEH